MASKELGATNIVKVECYSVQMKLRTSIRVVPSETLSAIDQAWPQLGHHMVAQKYWPSFIHRHYSAIDTISPKDLPDLALRCPNLGYLSIHMHAQELMAGGKDQDGEVTPCHSLKP